MDTIESIRGQVESIIRSSEEFNRTMNHVLRFLVEKIEMLQKQQHDLVDFRNLENGLEELIKSVDKHLAHK